MSIFSNNSNCYSNSNKHINNIRAWAEIKQGNEP